MNKNRKAKRKQWEEYGLHEANAVRIHIAMPSSKKFNLKTEFVGNPILKQSARRENDLLLYLDYSNIHHLLGEEVILYQVLAAATNTSKDTWPILSRHMDVE